MKGTIRNMNTVARELSAGRAAAKKAAKSFAVRSLTKAGTVSKVADSPMNLTDTLEQAEARKAMMEKMNPGRSFVIVKI